MIRRPAGEPPKLKISQLEEDIIYLLCPNKTCNIFFDDSYKYTPCNHHCPMPDKLLKIVKCKICKDMIELPETYNSWQRIDHACKKYDKFNGVGSSFISGELYCIIYEKPTKD